MVLPLEQAALIAVLNNVMGRLFAALGSTQAYKMLRDLEAESDSLKQDLHMLAAAVDDELTGSRGTTRSTAIARAYSREMRALTHDVDDCIERFVHRIAGSRLEGASWLRRAAHRVCTLRTCYRFAAEIRRLKRRVEEASARVLKPPDGGSGQPSGSRPAAVLTLLGLDQVEVPPIVECAADSSSTKEEHGNASGVGDLDGEGKKPPVSPQCSLARFLGHLWT